MQGTPTYIRVESAAVSKTRRLTIAGLASVCFVASGLLLLSLSISGVLGLDLFSGTIYPFVLPFILAAGLAATVAATGLACRSIRVVAFWVAVPIQALLFLPFRFAMTRWPGGDDGRGMAWMILIGGGAILAAILSTILILIAVPLMIRSRPHRKTTGHDSP